MNHRNLFIPKILEVSKQCASCPFRAGNDSEFATVLNKLRVAENLKPLKGWDRIIMAVEAKKRIAAEVASRPDFICHHTAYETKGEALVKRPATDYRQCVGATKAYKEAAR